MPGCAPIRCQLFCPSYPYAIPNEFTATVRLAAGCPSTLNFNSEMQVAYTAGKYAMFVKCGDFIPSSYTLIGSECAGGIVSLAIPMKRVTPPPGRGMAALWVNATADYFGGTASALGLTGGYTPGLSPLDQQGYIAWPNPLAGCVVPQILISNKGSDNPTSGSPLGVPTDPKLAGGAGYLEFGANLGIALALSFGENCNGLLQAYLLDLESTFGDSCPPANGDYGDFAIPRFPTWTWTLSVPDFAISKDFMLTAGQLWTSPQGFVSAVNSLGGGTVAAKAGVYDLSVSTSGLVADSSVQPFAPQACGCIALKDEYTLTVSGDCDLLNGSYPVKWTGQGEPLEWAYIDLLRDFRLQLGIGGPLNPNVHTLSTPVGVSPANSFSCDPFVVSGSLTYSYLSSPFPPCGPNVPNINCGNAPIYPPASGVLHWTVS